MRAAVITAPGTAPVCTQFPDPEAGPGIEVMELVAAGVHPIVKARAAGLHYSSDDAYPQVPGVDAVARTADGRLVYTGWAREPWGTLAERMATPIGLPLPEGADPVAVAGGLNPALSGWLPLISRRDELAAGAAGAPEQSRAAAGAQGGPAPDEGVDRPDDRLGTVLILGATGMAGTLAARSAFALGAQRVVAAGRDARRLDELAGLGAACVSLRSDDPAGGLADALAGEAPSLVLDFCWGTVAEAAYAALMRGDDEGDTVYVEIGSMAGPTAALPGALLRSRRLRLVGSGLGSVSLQVLMAQVPEVMRLIADGTLPVPTTSYPLTEVGRAFAHTGPTRAVVVP